MIRTRTVRRLLLAPILLLVICGRAMAQAVDPATLLNPPADTWLTYHGDYSGKRHSQPDRRSRPPTSIR